MTPEDRARELCVACVVQKRGWVRPGEHYHKEIAAALREADERGYARGERETVDRCVDVAREAVPEWVERYSWPEGDYVPAREQVQLAVARDLLRTLLPDDTETDDG